jgi:hypothetical protein
VVRATDDDGSIVAIGFMMGLENSRKIDALIYVENGERSKMVKPKLRWEMRPS